MINNLAELNVFVFDLANSLKGAIFYFFLSAFVLDKILFIYKEPSLLTYSSSIVQEMVLKPSVGKDELLFTEGKYLDILFEELLIKS